MEKMVALSHFCIQRTSNVPMELDGREAPKGESQGRRREGARAAEETRRGFERARWSKYAIGTLLTLASQVSGGRGKSVAVGLICIC
jgi:hypothetical protein